MTASLSVDREAGSEEIMFNDMLAMSGGDAGDVTLSIVTYVVDNDNVTTTGKSYTLDSSKSYLVVTNNKSQHDYSRPNCAVAIVENGQLVSDSHCGYSRISFDNNVFSVWSTDGNVPILVNISEYELT